MKRILFILSAFSLLFIGHFALDRAEAISIFQGQQGGTGISTSTAGNVGNCIKVTSSSPFLTYDLSGNCSGGGSSSLTTSSPFLSGGIVTVVNGNTISASSSINASSVQASILDIGGQVFNVRAYGAKCDGVTQDGTAIQSAINAASNVGGGKVLLCAGTMRNDTVAIVPKDNVSVWGHGKYATTILGSPTSSYDFYGSGITGFELHDMTINMNFATNGSGVRFEAASGTVTQNVRFLNGGTGGWGYVLGVANASSDPVSNFNNKVIDVDFDTHRGSLEMMLLMNASGTQIIRPTFINNATGSPTLGLYQKLFNTTISYPIFRDDNGVGIYYDISVQNTLIDHPYFQNTGNAINGANGPDVGTFGLIRAQNMQIVNPVMVGGANSTQAVGINIGAINNMSVLDPNISGYQIGINISTGLAPANATATNWSIIGGQIYNNNASNDVFALHPAIAIGGGGGCLYGLIEGVHIYDNQTSTTQRYPIDFDTNNFDCITISDNQLSAGSGGTSINLSSGATLGNNIKIYSNQNFTGSTPPQAFDISSSSLFLSNNLTASGSINISTALNLTGSGNLINMQQGSFIFNELNGNLYLYAGGFANKNFSLDSSSTVPTFNVALDSGNTTIAGTLNTSSTITQAGVPVCLSTTCGIGTGSAFSFPMWNASGTAITGSSSISASGWLYSRSIIVTSTVSIASGTQTNFPMLVNIPTSTYLQSTSTGGRVNNVNGYDISFSTSTACTNPLTYEREVYVSSTGQLAAWVSEPTLSAGTVNYICYGNTNISTDQTNATAVWNSNFKGVWHLSDNAATGTVKDSTSNANNLNFSRNTSLSSVAGQIGNALSFTTFYASSSASNVGLPTTISGLFNTSGIGAFQAIFAHDTGGNNGIKVALNGSGQLDVTFGGVADYAFTNLTATANSWYYYSVSVAGNGGNATGTLAKVGSQPTTQDVSVGTLSGTPSKFWIGSSGNAGQFSGNLDETRISNIGQTTQWNTTESNNWASTSTFYTIGNEQPVGSIITIAAALNLLGSLNVSSTVQVLNTSTFLGRIYQGTSTSMGLLHIDRSPAPLQANVVIGRSTTGAYPSGGDANGVMLGIIEPAGCTGTAIDVADDAGGGGLFRIGCDGSMTKLGGGAINFGGGTLQFYRPGAAMLIDNNGDTDNSNLTLSAGSNGGAGNVSYILFKVNSVTQGAISPVGLAVGTQTAIAKLTVQNSATATAVMDVASSSGSSFFRITGAGNVGINTTQPSSTLHVVGTVMLAGSSTVVTPSIGGAIISGGCDSATSSIDSSYTSSTTAFITTAQNNPGQTLGGTWAYSIITAPGQITTYVCANISVTPNTTPYVIKVIR